MKIDDSSWKSGWPRSRWDNASNPQQPAQSSAVERSVASVACFLRSSKGHERCWKCPKSWNVPITSDCNLILGNTSIWKLQGKKPEWQVRSLIFPLKVPSGPQIWSNGKSLVFFTSKIITQIPIPSLICRAETKKKNYAQKLSRISIPFQSNGFPHKNGGENAVQQALRPHLLIPPPLRHFRGWTALGGAPKMSQLVRILGEKTQQNVCFKKIWHQHNLGRSPKK